MKTIVTLCSIPFILLLAGCGSNQAGEELADEMNAKLNKQLDLVDQKNDLIKDRMSVLENDNREMRELLEQVLANQENPADLNKQVAEILELQVDDLIANKLEGKVDDVGTVSPDDIRNEIAAYEKQKEEEQQAEREARRAEEEAQRAERRQEQLASMADDLGINDQQLQQLQVAQETMRTGFGDLFTQMREGGLSREDREAAFAGLREAHETIVKDFLSDEQAKNYLEKYSRGGDRNRGGGFGGGDRGGNRGGGGRGR